MNRLLAIRSIRIFGSITAGDLSLLEVYGNVNGAVTADSIENMWVRGSINGSVSALTGSATIFAGGSILADVATATGAQVWAGNSDDLGWNNPLAVISGTITASAGNISASAPGDISGAVIAGGGDVIGIQSLHGNITSTVTDSAGDISELFAGKSISGTLTASDGNIGTLTAGQNITATITASGSGYGVISSVTATYGSITGMIAATGGIGLVGWEPGIAAGVDITGTISSLTGDVLVYAGRDITGPMSGGTISSYLVLSAGHNITGNIRGNAIGSLFAGTDITSTTIMASGDVGTITAGHSIATTAINATGSIAEVLAGVAVYSPFQRGAFYLWDGTAAGEIRNATITAGGSIGLVGAFAMAGHTGSIHDAIITAEGGDIGTLTATDGMPNNVTATAHGSFGVIDPGDGPLAGSYTAQTGGLPSITATGSFISAGLYAAGTIGNITALESIAGAVVATESIGNILSVLGTISASITSTTGSIGNLTAGLDITGNITSVAESIGNIIAGGNLSGNVSAHGSIGTVLVMGTLSGYLLTTAGSIGGILVMGDITSYISAHSGEIDAVSFGSITGSVSGNDNISILASGQVSGNVVTGFGNVDIAAGGNITSGTISDTGDMALSSLSDITTAATSHDGGVFERAAGTLTSTVTAKTDAQLSAGMIRGTNATAESADFSAFTLSDSTLTGSKEAFSTAAVFYGSMEDGAAMSTPVCFAARTPVMLADGSTRAIEMLAEGIIIPAVMENDPSGKPILCKVEKVFRNRPARIYHVHVANRIIRCTALHPFYVKDHGWKHARDLFPGDWLLSNTSEALRVQRVEDSGVDEPVFNLQVQNAHTYFVALEENGPAVLVHNDSGGSSGSTGNGGGVRASTPAELLYEEYFSAQASNYDYDHADNGKFLWTIPYPVIHTQQEAQQYVKNRNRMWEIEAQMPELRYWGHLNEINRQIAEDRINAEAAAIAGEMSLNVGSAPVRYTPAIVQGAPLEPPQVINIVPPDFHGFVTSTFDGKALRPQVGNSWTLDRSRPYVFSPSPGTSAAANPAVIDELIGPTFGKTGFRTTVEFRDAVFAKYQQFYNEGYTDTMNLVRQGLIANNRTAIGTKVDAFARTALRKWLASEGIEEGPGQIIAVNRRLYNPSGNGAYRIPDIYIPGTGTIFDGTIGLKRGSFSQIIDFRNFSGRGNVIIVRPLQLVYPPNQPPGSYGLIFP